MISSGIAVLDLGSARTKLLVANQSINGSVSFERFKEETGLGSALDTNNNMNVAAGESLKNAIKRLVKQAVTSSCDKVICVATDSLRAACNGSAILEDLQPTIGTVSILNEKIEGKIYYEALRMLTGLETDFVAIDVGGGSVQICWGIGDNEVVSIPTGTFRLQNEFHKESLPTVNTYIAMEESVVNYAKKALPPELRVDKVIFGSNCMLDFLKSALNATGYVSASPNDLPLAVINAIYDEIKGRPYDSLAPYYPENPMFMYGADKALLNLVVISGLVFASHVTATNESISTGIARLALSEPDRLKQFGLSIHSLGIS